MKDYTNNQEDKINFVKNFKVYNGDIIAHMGDNTKVKVPYTEENEQKLLRRMRNQTKNIKQKVTYFKKGFIGRAALTGGLIATTAATIGANPQLGPSFFGINGITLLSGAGALIMTNSTRRFFENLKDAQKTEFFLENENFINNNINKSPNILKGVSRRLRKKVEKTKNDNKPTLNLNNIDIDKWSIDDLRQIRNNINVIKNLGLNEEEIKNKNDRKEIDSPTISNLF